MTVSDTLDRIFFRILCVQPQPADAAETAPAQERAVGLALLISGTRCILQYVVLPVVLPLIGLAGGLSFVIVVLLDVIALGLLISGLRYFWRSRHPRRFDILPLAGLIFIIILGSLTYDIWHVLR
jgi:hypothetical protein